MACRHVLTCNAYTCLHATHTRALQRPEHVDIRSRRCSASACTRQPSFRDQHEPSRLFCSLHAHAMLQCISPLPWSAPGDEASASALGGLGTWPTPAGGAGGAGGATAASASSDFPKSQPLTLVRLGRRKCGVESCSTVAIFGQQLPDGSFRRRCAVHREAGDSDLSWLSCSVAGCSRRSVGRLRAGTAPGVLSSSNPYPN
jgi:hypothetical protein